MPVDWSEFEVVEDSPVDWSEFEVVSEPIDRAAQRETLLAEQKTSREEGDKLSRNVNLLGAAEGAVEAMTIPGIINTPNRIANKISTSVGGPKFVDLIGQNQPAVDVPEPKGTGVMAGLGRVGSRFVEGMTTAENLVTLPLAGPSQLMRAAFGGAMASQLPRQAEHLGETFGNPESTVADKTAAIAEPVLTTGIVALTALPKSSNAVAKEKADRAKIAEETTDSRIDEIKTPQETVPFVENPQAFEAAKSSGLKLENKVEPKPIEGPKIPANREAVELLADERTNPVDVSEPINPIRQPEYEPNIPQGRLNPELASDVRRMDFEKGRGEKVVQDLAEPVDPGKPLTENQLRIIRDSLVKAVDENRFSEDRPGLISGTKLEAWADKELSSLDSWGKVSLNPIGEYATRFAAASIKGAALLERGITNAAEWTATMLKEYGDEIKPYLASIRKEAEALRSKSFNGGTGEVGMREFGKKVMASEEISELVKSAVTEYGYSKRSNETDSDFSRRIIQERGIDEAIREFTNPETKLPGAVTSALGKNLIKELSVQEKSARATDPKLADEIASKQVDLIDADLRRSTDIAQSLQAMRLFGDASPSAIVRFAEREIRKNSKTEEQAEAVINSPEFRKVIVKKANDIQSKPEGFQRQNEILDTLNHIANQTPNKWYDLPLSYWYSNILSGPLTHVRNVLSTTLNTASQAAIEVAKRPQDLLEIANDLGKGLEKGGIEAAEVLKTGRVTGTRSNKLEASRPLERKKFEGLAYPLNGLKYVGRALIAEDMLFFKAAEELKAASAARMVARKEGLSGKELQQRVADILARTEEKVNSAKEQATQEGLTGRDYTRRVNEIMEQKRPTDIRENAKEFALNATFNGDPYGLLGAMARAMNKLNQEAVVTRAIVPFVNVVANVTNESLNYVPPVGFGRAVYGSWSGKLHGKPITDKTLLHDQYAKAALGTMAMSAVAVLAAKNLNNQNPDFMVSGMGPKDKDRRNQLRETGWMPNSFKIKDRYVSYANTPVAIPMAIVGNYMDALKYGGLEKADALNRAAYASMMAMGVILDQSFVKGIADLFRTVNQTSVKTTGGKVADTFGRTAAGAAIPYSSALKQIDRVFDPKIYSSDDVVSGLVNQTPFVRSSNRPALNALGEPVSVGPMDSFSKKLNETDPVWKLLNRKKAWVTVPDKEVIVGSKKRGEGHWRALTSEERYDFIKESGANIKKQLTQLLPKLEKLEDEQVKQVVSKIVEDERARSKAKYLKSIYVK